MARIRKAKASEKKHKTNVAPVAKRAIMVSPVKASLTSDVLQNKVPEAETVKPTVISIPATSLTKATCTVPMANIQNPLATMISEDHTIWAHELSNNQECVQATVAIPAEVVRPKKAYIEINCASKDAVPRTSFTVKSVSITSTANNSNVYTTLGSSLSLAANSYGTSRLEIPMPTTSSYHISITRSAGEYPPVFITGVSLIFTH